MINKSSRKVWNELQQVIMTMDERDTAVIIFEKVRSWYKKNRRFLSQDLIKKYKIEELISINTEDYPLIFSETTPQTVRRFLHFEPSSEDSLVMCLRDQLWELIVFIVDTECHRCENLGLSTWVDSEAQKIVLECTQCGWIQTTDGQPYDPLAKLRLAKSKDLESAGLI